MVGAKTPRRKHSRSRTGCFTCRKRRVKCDEKRPICTRCEKGSRECSYPPPAAPKKSGKARVSPTKTVDPETSSDDSAEDIDEFEEDEEEASGSSAVVKFSSAISPDSSNDSNDLFERLHLDEQMAIDSLTPPSFPMEPLFSPSPIVFTSVFGESPASYSHSLRLDRSSITVSPTSVCVQSPSPSLPLRSLRTTRLGSSDPHFDISRMEFLIDYHRRKINHAHYFRAFDYAKLYPEIIFAIAEAAATEPEHNALLLAMAAFSALIYSIKNEDGLFRIQAFEFYSRALRELIKLLGNSAMDLTECHVAVATALELAAFDRFFGEPKNSFRHVTGAAKIVQQFTDPVEFCSTIAGRALLEWYMQVEDYSCFLGAYRLVLPPEWRDEDIRVRAAISGDYSHVPPRERKARILDDIWVQFLAMVPRLSDILCDIPELQKKEADERAEAARKLELDLRLWEEEIDHFVQTRFVVEVLEPAESPPPFLSRHAVCCPQPPFIPHYLQYPPAGIFHLTISSLKCYIRQLMLPSIREALGTTLEKTDEEASEFSVESCRAFAGLEETLGDGDPDVLLPLFASLVLAASTCPPECRLWLECKLNHFKKAGRIQMDPIMKNLAKLWSRPQMASGSSPTQDVGVLTDIEPGIRELGLQGDAGGESDHEPITRARGLGPRIE